MRSEVRNLLPRHYKDGSNVKAKRILKVVGITEDKKFVVSNVGKFYDTIGLPLCIIINELEQNGFVIDWIDFINYSIKNNWNISQTISMIEDSLLNNNNRFLIIEKIKKWVYSSDV